MHPVTRLAFNAYLKQIAQLNGIADPTQKFTVTPRVQQQLETRLQASSAFLSKINVMGVTEQEGEKLGLGVGSPIASTTDTNQQDRQTHDPSSLDSRRYRAEQTNFDTHLTYAKLDAWAQFPDFQTRIRDAILQRQALDRITIGLNGRQRAATSDPAKYPLLQDVNLGWLQHYRNEAPQRVLSEGKTQRGKVIIGPNGDYATLDALVFDAVNHLLDPWYQEDTALVVICGRALLQDKYFPLLNTTQPPTEQLAADLILSQQRIGHLPAVRVPFFPAHTLMVTRLDNLSLYWQVGARRRTMLDNAKRDRIEYYESSNDAYVVEDFGAGCVVEQIELVEPPAPPSVDQP